MSKADEMRIMYHKKNFEVYFGEGIPDRQEECRNKLIYPEELLDKKCGGCVRCEKRDHAYYGTKWLKWADKDEQNLAMKQEPKSEWEQDHAVLKAYSDGANEVLDKLRAEIGNINLNEV